MLLGYINEIVKDTALAEKYMVSVFTSLAEQSVNDYLTDNTWCRLQQIAKTKLAGFTNTVQDCNDYAKPYLDNNSLLNLMTDEQKNIFCAVYYHGQTTAELAKQLNISESDIRKALKEALAIIRQRREH